MRSSLARRLLGWTLGALAVVWVSHLAIGVRTGIVEAEEVTDGHLASVASILLSERDGQYGQRPDMSS